MLASSGEASREQYRRTQNRVIKALPAWEIRDTLPNDMLEGLPNANAVPGLTPAQRQAVQERLDALTGAGR